VKGRKGRRRTGGEDRDRRSCGKATESVLLGFDNHKGGGLEKRKKVDREEEGL
jgi:hypothetical protein